MECHLIKTAQSAQTADGFESPIAAQAIDDLAQSTKPAVSERAQSAKASQDIAVMANISAQPCRTTAIGATEDTKVSKAGAQAPSTFTAAEAAQSA